MTFYLLRHGQTDWNKEQKLQGQKDIPMNDEGIRQMKELARRSQMESGIEF
jgi:broad specificity phosphatase PhoE